MAYRMARLNKDPEFMFMLGKVAAKHDADFAHAVLQAVAEYAIKENWGKRRKNHGTQEDC